MKPIYFLFRAAKVFTLLFFIGALLYVYFYLPEQIAVHFNQYGQADNYLTKSEFFYGAGLFIILFNVAVSILGRFVVVLPPGMIRVPNREFWLATKESRNVLNHIVRNWLNGLLALINLLLIASLLVILSVNAEAEAGIDDYAWVFLVAIAVLIGWVVYLPVRLRLQKAVVE